MAPRRASPLCCQSLFPALNPGLRQGPPGLFGARSWTVHLRAVASRVCPCVCVSAHMCVCPCVCTRVCACVCAHPNAMVHCSRQGFALPQHHANATFSRESSQTPSPGPLHLCHLHYPGPRGPEGGLGLMGSESPRDSLSLRGVGAQGPRPDVGAGGRGHSPVKDPRK